jgi:uncharacterized protein YjdB
MTRMPFPRRFAFLIALLGSTACSELFVDPAPAEPSGLAVSFSVTGHAAGGAAEAFDRADRVRIRLVRADETTVLDTVVTLSAAGGSREASVAVALQQDQETLFLDVQLLFQSQVLFTGSSSVTLRQNQTSSADIGLSPVIARLDLPAEFPVITAIGNRVTFTGAAVFATGDTVRGVTITFSTPETNILTLSPNGEAIALAEGDARIIATGGGMTGNSRVSVRATVAEVRTLVPDVQMNVHDQITLQFTALDSNGNALQRTGDWRSSAPQVASVDNTGRVMALTPGTADITVTVGTLSATTRVTVLDDPILAVLVEPTLSTILVGQQVVFRATGFRASGTPVTNAQVTWRSDDPTIATIDSQGTATGIAAGAALIVATIEGVEGYAALTVNAAQVFDPVLSNLQISLASLNDPLQCPSSPAPWSLFNISADYNDPSGNITNGSAVLGSWRFLPSNTTGAINFSVSVSNPFVGTYSDTFCLFFASDQTFELTVELVSAVGRSSNQLTAVIPRPSGANEPPPGSVTVQGAVAPGVTRVKK